jgi:hypothetical protein
MSCGNSSVYVTGALVVLGCALVGCTGPEALSPCELASQQLESLQLTDVRYPRPAVAGTTLLVRGDGFVTHEACATVSASLHAGGQELDLVVQVKSPNELTAQLPAESLDVLGDSAGDPAQLIVEFDVLQGDSFRAELAMELDVSRYPEPRLQSFAQTSVYLNDLVPLAGDSFLDGGDEGQTELLFAGSFISAGGISDVSGVVSSQLLDTIDRSRSQVRWSPALGGVAPGVFRGTVMARNTFADGTVVLGQPLEAELVQRRTVLFSISPDTLSLGQIADLRGRGFVGSPEQAGHEQEGTTSFRLEGEFFACGSSLNDCDRQGQAIERELVGSWVSGELVRYTVAVSNEGGRLRAVDFGSQRGSFLGQVTPVLSRGRQRVEGVPLTDVSLVLGPVKQVVWMRFLPGFSDSLELFGLGAVHRIVEERIRQRVQDIYCPPGEPHRWVNVEFRGDEPTDFYPGAYAILDIGGPDPNNLGFFGYDNTPGKDIGNLRLWDHVGGANALGMLDGYGYGGVFVESMLFWSAHPPLEQRPAGAPPVDDRFDEIFDPLRQEEVVAGEYPDGEEVERVEAIERGISFLVNMVADTAAHEFGHSLGLAQPYIPDGAYHNAFPSEGCLMDSGRDRPLEERAGLDGNAGARFCKENLWYLREILPVE